MNTKPQQTKKSIYNYFFIFSALRKNINFTAIRQTLSSETRSPSNLSYINNSFSLWGLKQHFCACFVLSFLYIHFYFVSSHIINEHKSTLCLIWILCEGLAKRARLWISAQALVIILTLFFKVSGVKKKFNATTTWKPSEILKW